MRQLAFILPVVLFLMVAAALGLGLRRDPGILPSMLIDRPIPTFDLPGLTPEDTEGLASSDFTGKPLLLNVFASWCVACVIEHPMLLRLQSQGVTIHGLDWKDEPADGAAWLAERGNPYALIGSDPRGRTGIDFGVTGAPETFVIDAHGRVRYRHVGPITPEVWTETLQPMLDRLENESTKRLVLGLFCALLFAGPVAAVLPEEQLADPVLEARARAISQELRCVVCQNQSIDDSDAPLAADLRAIVRERLTAGDTDEEVMAYIVARYGNFVLLKPPLDLQTILLWSAPLLVLIPGGLGLALYLRRRSRAGAADPAPLSAEERRALADILKAGDAP